MSRWRRRSRDLYGRNGAETISGLCGTRVVLAAPDRDTAQWSADSLGRSEVEEVSENVSYGANTIRDGVSLTPRRELRALALPADIMRLPNLHGYLKFPGPYPVASIALKPVGRAVLAPRFVPREDREAPAGAAGNPAPEPSAETPDSAGPAPLPEVADETLRPGGPDRDWCRPGPGEPASTAPTALPGTGNGAGQVPVRPVAAAAAPPPPTASPASPRKVTSPGSGTGPSPAKGGWA